VARSLQEKELASAVAVSHSAMRSIESNRRAFYRQLKKVVEKADVILVVLDARDPMVRRTRCLCK
jgi:ribosome biogenesis GTPase A